MWRCLAQQRRQVARSTKTYIIYLSSADFELLEFKVIDNFRLWNWQLPFELWALNYDYLASVNTVADVKIGRDYGAGGLILTVLHCHNANWDDKHAWKWFGCHWLIDIWTQFQIDLLQRLIGFETWDLSTVCGIFRSTHELNFKVDENFSVQLIGIQVMLRMKRVSQGRSFYRGIFD